jgi:hypothetical protein
LAKLYILAEYVREETQFPNEGTLPLLCHVDKLVNCLGVFLPFTVPFLALYML